MSQIEDNRECYNEAMKTPKSKKVIEAEEDFLDKLAIAFFNAIDWLMSGGMRRF
jgi:hypothetical protein